MFDILTNWEKYHQNLLQSKEIHKKIELRMQMWKKVEVFKDLNRKGERILAKGIGDSDEGEEKQRADAKEVKPYTVM